MGAHGAQGPRPPTKSGLPPNPSIFISPQASHQLNPALGGLASFRCPISRGPELQMVLMCAWVIKVIEANI